MTWRGTQAASRNRHLEHYDAKEVERYESWVQELTKQDDQACLDDLAPDIQFRRGMSVLDVGAGTGAMCNVLSSIQGLLITALEPSPLMLAKLQAKPALGDVKVVQGFCDSAADRSQFKPQSFDAIVSRQLTNGLFDPLTAFDNWRYWLKPEGTVVVIDGLYDRSAWAGPMQEEVDRLPLSACRSMAATPYLLETCGFEITSVRFMEATNALPATRTQRYLVIARNVV